MCRINSLKKDKKKDNNIICFPENSILIKASFNNVLSQV